MNESNPGSREKKQSQAKDLLLLFFVGLAVQLLAAWPIRQPGTMDSHYYYLGGQSLLKYHAFIEPVIWNYLNNPPVLPAPSHLYWMPLPSILSALSQALFGPSFRAAQAPFILLAACLPILTYLTGWQLSQNRRHALVAGFLGVFSGFFLPYWSLPETFAPFAITGALALYFQGIGFKTGQGRWLLLAGAASGLGHLCRADGALLLLTGLFLALFLKPRRSVLLSFSLLLAGYLAVMAFWFIRNLNVAGSLLPAAGVETIFMRNYDELYSYGTQLDWNHYWSWGVGNILMSKLQAAWTNLQTFIGVNNLVFLTPLSLVGFWKTRKDPFILPAILYGVAMYGAMTLLFTFPGARGGVFHSCAALLPAVFAASMTGLDVCIDWAARRRRWDRQGARRFFSFGIILLSACLSLFVYRQRVIGNGSWSAPAWNRADAIMHETGVWLAESGGYPNPIVMVGNPPAFYYHTGLQAIAVPNENAGRVLEAAHKYGARFLVLDQNRPAPLADLYDGRETVPGLSPVWEKGPVRVYMIGNE